MSPRSPESTPEQPLADGKGVFIHPTRRDAIIAGLLAGAGLLTGCSSRNSKPNLVGTPIPTRTGASQPGPSAGSSPSQSLTTLPPGVIPRRNWTSAAPIASLVNPMVRVDRITIHHDAINSADVTSKTAAQRRLGTIRQGHLDRDFADIGYHFIVDPQGNIWEGRPLRYQGAHVKDQNERNMGVMVMGNFMEQAPTPAALAALDTFVASQMQRFAIPMWKVKTHRELAPTACPGNALQRYMIQTRGTSGRMARA